MQCQNAKEMLDARMDGELPLDRADRLDRHLKRCTSCAREAEALRTLAMALDAMPFVRPPARLARRTMQAFRAGREYPGILQWWKSLGFAMRGAACGAAMAGLLLGIILGTSLGVLPTAVAATDYIDALYHTGGILP